MIYLACPYTHENKKVEAVRAHAASLAAAELIRQGRIVFSPLSHGHAINLAADPPLSGSWDRWKEFDLKVLSVCDLLVILALEGWVESRGVRGEVALALELKIPVEVHAPETVGRPGYLSDSAVKYLKDAGLLPAGGLDNSISDRPGGS
jgi:hypothetical protein